MEQQNADSSADSGRRSSAIVISKDDLMTVAPPKPAAPPRQGLAPQPPPLPEPAPVVPSIPAGFWLRLLAKVLDLGIVLAAFIVGGVAIGAVVWLGCLGFPLPAWEAVRPALPRIAWQLFVGYGCFYCFYSVVVHAANGRSIGKTICRIRVVSTRGAAGSILSSLLYFFARFLISTMSLMLLGIGHALAGFRADKCALNDLVVGSQVVKEPSTRK